MHWFIRSVSSRLNTPLTRVGLVAAGILAGTAVAGSRAAQAQTGLALGALAEQVEDMTPSDLGGAHAISVNGLQLASKVSSFPISKADALAIAKEKCRNHGGMQSAAIGEHELEKLRSAKEERLSKAADGLFVEETPQGTVVACIDTHGVPWLSHDMLKRLKAFMKSGELSELGVARYTLVKGNEEQATLVELWSEGKAPLLTLFPAEGDVPGGDHPFIPRAGGRRILSARVAQSHLVAYEHPDERAEDVWDELLGRSLEVGLEVKELPSEAHAKRAWVKKGATESLLVVRQTGSKTISTMFDAP